MPEIDERIKHDISAFDENVKVMDESKPGPKEVEIIRMAKDYRKDAESWLEKKDFFSAFASISYAHGLLDTLIKLETDQ